MTDGCFQLSVVHTGQSSVYEGFAEPFLFTCPLIVCQAAGNEGVLMHGHSFFMDGFGVDQREKRGIVVGRNQLPAVFTKKDIGLHALHIELPYHDHGGVGMLFHEPFSLEQYLVDLPVGVFRVVARPLSRAAQHHYYHR